MATKRKPTRKPARVAATKLATIPKGGKSKARPKPVKRSFPMGTAQLIRKAEAEFIKDEEGRSVDWHFQNGEWEKYIAIDTFRAWSKKYKWVSRRIEYWENIQTRLLNHLADKILDQKFKELGQLQELKEAVAVMLKPLSDEDGKILIDERGLPQFAVDLPPYDRLVKAFLELDQRIALRTGDVTQRIEISNDEAAESKPTERRLLSSEEAATFMSISPEQARSMARQLLMERNEHLEDDVIDAEYEDGDEL